MEYDPAVSTHKASSITSTTSTSSSSSWEHPTPTYTHHIKTEDDEIPFEGTFSSNHNYITVFANTNLHAFKELSFNSSLLVDRISIPSFDYAEDSNNFQFHNERRHRKSTILSDSFITSNHPSAATSTDTDNENSTLTNIVSILLPLHFKLVM